MYIYNGNEIHSAGAFEKKSFERLKALLNVLETCDNDFQRSIKIRRICSSFALFEKSFYLNGKMRENFVPYQDKIETLRDLYMNYEKSGLFGLAEEENKFLLKEEGDLDSRYIINAYINDFYSYDLDKFLPRYGITKRILDKCINRVRANDSELYAKFLEVENNNKTKRLVLPIYNVNSIVEGINTGKTLEGKKFDVFEFYKVAPFTDKDFDHEIRIIGKDFPKLLKFKLLKQQFNNEKQNTTSVRGCTYADNLYLFAKCFNEKDAETLKNWMENNGVRTLTRAYEAQVVGVYACRPRNDEFNVEDAEEIFDIMKEQGYPKTHEVFDLFKSEKIKENKTKRLVLEEKE